MERSNIVIEKIQELSFEELIQIVGLVMIGLMLSVVLIWRRKVFKASAKNALARYMDQQMTSE